MFSNVLLISYFRVPVGMLLSDTTVSGPTEQYGIRGVFYQRVLLHLELINLGHY